MSGKREVFLLRDAESFPDFTTLESLTAEVLQQITADKGVDFATALLFDRFKKSPKYSGFIQQIDMLRQQSASRPQQLLDWKIAIVPGALYLERPEMGGDGQLVREVVEDFGWRCELVPLASVGSITDNARLLRVWLAGNSGKKIILVSLSKGGADVKMALASPDAAGLFRNVIAWVNVCGPLNGSRMADWVLQSRARSWFLQRQYRWQKRDFKFVTDLRHEGDAPLNFVLYPLASMKVLNLIGFPLKRHMTTLFSRFCHRTLAAWGPNDGTTSLSDLNKWPGEIYPVWGVDHYFRPESRARQIIAAVLEYLTKNRLKEPCPENGTPAVAVATKKILSSV